MGQEIPPLRKIGESEEEYYWRLYTWAQRGQWLRIVVIMSAVVGFITMAWLLGR